MATASWNDAVIATDDATVVVEGNHYFSPDGVDDSKLTPSHHRTTCPWKGEAHYYHIVVDGQTNENAAWYYPEPKPAAAEIKGRLAFWKGVDVRS